MASSEKKALVKAWLDKAESDLGAARALILGPERYLDSGAYHCQQAAEKSLKATLTFHDIPFPKTHNLSELLASCQSFDSSAMSFMEFASLLTPYASEFRYPGDLFAPSFKDAKEALIMADAFLQHAKRSLC